MDVYDFLKDVKKHMKISKALQSTDINAPYASDVPNCSYQVINHRTGEATKLEFTMNSTLQRGSNKVISKTDLPPVGKLIQDHRFNEAQYEKQLKAAIGGGAADLESSKGSEVNSSVYSLKRHHDRPSRRVHSQKKKRSTSRKRTDYPQGTIEPIKEETADSAAVHETL